MIDRSHIRSWERRLVHWGSVLLIVLALTAGAGEQKYVVKRNDTLYGLARRHGISVTQLAARNGLSAHAHLFIGQRLVIPPKTAVKAANPPVLDKSSRKAIASARVSPGRWRYIVIHHSGVDVGTIKSMDRYHREKRHMENGLAYHFVIGNGHGIRDGQVIACHRWRKQLAGGHVHSEAQNRISIGICLVGNFDKHKPTAKEIRSLNALVVALLKRCNLKPSAVKTHQQINTTWTRCPGKYFPTESFLKQLKATE